MAEKKIISKSELSKVKQRSPSLIDEAFCSDNKRYCEPRLIGDILEDILTELRYANQHSKEIDDRLAALESKDKVLRPKEAARFVGTTTHTLKNWVERGKIPMVERGGIRGYLLSDLKRIKTL